ncbi:hypothetical protein [Parafrankia discariae]|uniref:hypothetical protein n=1 Tax=Parafrankia discariae TaxID=365528 RepID=UPI00038282CB|nr:hypothetical protein [Parafrankia discariae]
MTLLVIAPDTDDTAGRFADFANRGGVPTVVAAEFGRVGITVRVTRDRVCRTRITIDEVEVSGVLTRGLGDWGHEPDTQRAFVSAERYAAFWSAVALWPGPVVNRPSARGFFPRLDPLELARYGAVAPPRTVILNAGSAPGTTMYRLPSWAMVDPDAPRSRFDVVQIGDSDPSRTRRVVLAGSTAFDVSTTGDRLDPDLADRVAPVISWLRRSGMDFVDFTVELEDGVTRLLDVSCWPDRRLFPLVEERVYTALLNRLTS